MKRVELIISPNGGILCHDKECLYWRECANHVTAGDYRSEGGMSPQFSHGDVQGLVFCETSIANPIYGKFATVPVNVDELGRGEVFFENGKFKSDDLEKYRLDSKAGFPETL